MAPPLLGLTFSGRSVGDPVTLVVLVGVFLIESPVEDRLVGLEGEGIGAALGGGPVVAPGGGGSPSFGSMVGEVLGRCWSWLLGVAAAFSSHDGVVTTEKQSRVATGGSPRRRRRR